MKQTKVFKVDSIRPDGSKIKEAARIVKEGGVVAFPTETVYGLAAVSSQEMAVEKLRHIKRRQEEKKFSLCIHCIEQAEELSADISPFAYRLMREFWPGPLTLVLKAKDEGTVGLRMPDHEVARLLLKKVGIAVFAPSANFAGEKPSVCAEDVLRSFDGRIDAVLDSGRTRLGVSSTVCQVYDTEYKILRLGAIDKEKIDAFSKFKNILFVCTGNSCRSAMAEGLMKKMVEGSKRFHITSAGVAAYDGMPATNEALVTMEREGVDISQHKARRLTGEMIKTSDLILVMERGHKRYILEQVRSAEERVFLLKEFAGDKRGDLNIPDPIGRDVSFYEQVAVVLKESIERLVETLQ